MLRLIGFILKNDDDELEAHPVSAKSTSIKCENTLIDRRVYLNHLIKCKFFVLIPKFIRFSVVVFFKVSCFVIAETSEKLVLNT